MISIYSSRRSAAGWSSVLIVSILVCIAFFRHAASPELARDPHQLQSQELARLPVANGWRIARCHVQAFSGEVSMCSDELVVSGEGGSRNRKIADVFPWCQDCIVQRIPNVKAVADIQSRIHRLSIERRRKALDYSLGDYRADGEFAATADYSLRGADRDSPNPTTKTNAGLQAWSRWHRGGRQDGRLLEVAVQVGRELRQLLSVRGKIPLPRYKEIVVHEEGWISGISLKALALWSRLWSVEQEGSEKIAWRNAVKIMASHYLRPVTDGGVLSRLSDVDPSLADLWVPEEYPHLASTNLPQRHVLNGAQFAILALHNAATLLRDPLLFWWFNVLHEGVLAIAKLSAIEVGCWRATSYDLSWRTGLKVDPWLNGEGYHVTHVVMAGELFRATKDERWSELAVLWNSMSFPTEPSAGPGNCDMEG